MNKKKIIRTTHYAAAICKTCKEIIESVRGGDFVSCKCSSSFIDQERMMGLYARCGGEAQLIDTICPANCKIEAHTGRKREKYVSKGFFRDKDCTP